MPIQDPIKRKEYARLSMAILKAKKEGRDITQLLAQRKGINIVGINSNEGIKGINDFIPSPGIKQNSEFIPKRKINSENFTQLQTEIYELKTQLEKFSRQITISLTEIKEQLTNSFTQLFTSQPTNPSPRKKTTFPTAKKPTQTQLTPEEKDEKRRAYQREYNKLPHRKAQLAQYKKNALLKKKLAREMKNNNEL